jgi:hypothetical protein
MENWEGNHATILGRRLNRSGLKRTIKMRPIGYKAYDLAFIALRL